MQLEIDLNDSNQRALAYCKNLIEKYQITPTSNTQLYFFKSRKEGKVWLGTRTFYYETEYTHDYLISYEDALYLKEQNHNINTFSDEIRNKLSEMQLSKNQKGDK